MPIYRIPGFPKGMINTGRLYEMPEGSCRDAVNVDFDNVGNIARRRGRTKVYSGTYVHSVVSDGVITVFVDDTTLYRLNADYTATSLHTGLAAGRPLSWFRHAGQLWFSNGVDNGRIVNGEYKYWSPEQAPNTVIATATDTGGLFPGDYSVGVSFSHGANGEEGGGDMLIGAVTVPEGGGIFLSNIPQPSVADTINIYCSAANGSELYLVAQLPVGATQYSINQFASDITFETLGWLPMPAGECIAGLGSRLYVSKGHVVYNSRPLRYGLYDPVQDFWVYQDPVTALCPAADGMYISTSKAIYFRTGIDTEAESQRLVASFGSPKMQAIRVPRPDGQQAFAWFTHRGWAIGLASGQLQLLHDGAAMPNPYTEGHGILREQNGVQTLIGCFSGNTDTAHPLAADDWKTRHSLT